MELERSFEKKNLNCHFDYPYITSENIRKWPKTCNTVCGNIIINENTNVSESELKDNFEKLENLNGTLKIQNSNIINVDFLKTLRSSNCDGDGLVISNNSNLSDISGLGSLIMYESCIWHIVKNPELDMSVCNTSEFEFLFDKDLESYGNKKDCECINIRITTESLPYYTNCTTISGGYFGVLKITNVSDSDDLAGFSKLEKINGNVEIYGTQLTNLTFFGNLQKMTGDVSQWLNNTIIRDNPNLRRLGWDSLKIIRPISSSFTLYIHNNHPDFCLSMYEAQIFAEAGVLFYNEDKVQLCSDSSRKDGQNVCYFGSLGSWDTTCQHVIGDVIVDKDNENEAWKLENMSHIYGNLAILETENLEDLSFLKNLKQIIQLNEAEVQIIRILSNKKLKKIEFPKMKMPPFPFIDDFQFIEINENSMKIFKNQKECLLLQAKTRTPVKYNWESCMELPKAPGGNGGLPEYVGFGGQDEMGDIWDEPRKDGKKKGKNSCGFLKFILCFVTYIAVINVLVVFSALLYIPVVISLSKYSHLPTAQQSKPQKFAFRQCIITVAIKSIIYPFVYFLYFPVTEWKLVLFFLPMLVDPILAPLIIQITYIYSNQRNVNSLWSEFNLIKFWKVVFSMENNAYRVQPQIARRIT